MTEILIALFLGIVEGLTEFIPVSSTGHLVILVDGLGFPAPPGHVFEVFIQLGSILAVMFLYRQRIFDTIIGLPKEKKAQNFTRNLILGTIPAMIAGALAHDEIKALYRPDFICWTLILGGIAILFLEKRLKKAEVETVDDIKPLTAFLIGCAQALALVPGVSRSGATIIGALGLGLARPAAAEFSFFLAMPAMAAAVAYDCYKNWDSLMASSGLHLMIIGFIAAFVSALFVVRGVIAFISRYGFAPFAWYRIAVGIAVFLFLT